MFFLQMSGFSGSGKSTLARVIAKNTGALVIDHDIVKTALLESVEFDSDEKSIGKIAYHIEWSLIEFHLANDKEVILDSPCLYSEMIEKGLDLSEKYEARYKYVECMLNDFEEINRRLTKRQRKLSQIEHVESEVKLRKGIAKSKKPDALQYISVNTSNPLKHYIDKVMDYIKAI
ncbi:AAA family ATPase [Aureibacillus halotolerans]|uniref:Putative kinase n=1 Tax=Aureibacillus halotolerans TaxID=1508390 RepID=A0A4R6UDS8_9BACI|nr:AAA family ATPase [Aureibacillus halotolerans]TDQ41254.1 putative kinase [Aureibacillus halotolerans]